MMARSMVVYESFLEATKEMDAETFKEIWVALLQYGLDGSAPDGLSGAAKMAFLLMKPNVDANKKRRKADGENNCEQLQTIVNNCEHLSNDEDVDEDKDEEIKEKHSKKKFFPPSVDDVRSYCDERGNSVNPESFVAYYSSNGWKVGRNPMKDWKAAVRTWENKEKSRPPTSWGNVPKRAYNMNDLEGRLVGL